MKRINTTAFCKSYGQSTSGWYYDYIRSPHIFNRSLYFQGKLVNIGKCMERSISSSEAAIPGHLIFSRPQSLVFRARFGDDESCRQWEFSSKVPRQLIGQLAVGETGLPIKISEWKRRGVTRRSFAAAWTRPGIGSRFLRQQPEAIVPGEKLQYLRRVATPNNTEK